jgi:hypothetical protein
MPGIHDLPNVVFESEIIGFSGSPKVARVHLKTPAGEHLHIQFKSESPIEISMVELPED